MEAIIGMQIWVIVKVLFLAAIGVYTLFSAVIVRQVQLMTDTLEVGFEAPVRIIAVLHFLVSIGVFILALSIL